MQKSFLPREMSSQIADEIKLLWFCLVSQASIKFKYL